MILNSTNPDSAPIIQIPRNQSSYLSSLDIAKLVWGVRQVIAISHTPPMSNLIDEIISPPLDIDESDELTNWVSFSTYHCSLDRYFWIVVYCNIFTLSRPLYTIVLLIHVHYTCISLPGEIQSLSKFALGRYCKDGQ